VRAYHFLLSVRKILYMQCRSALSVPRFFIPILSTSLCTISLLRLSCRWGYTGESYASKLGPQMVTFDAMRNHLTAAASLADVAAEPIDHTLFK
jgi:hypothetical protein